MVKSASQIRRAIKRATARGETYVIPIRTSSSSSSTTTVTNVIKCDQGSENIRTKDIKNDNNNNNNNKNDTIDYPTTTTTINESEQLKSNFPKKITQSKEERKLQAAKQLVNDLKELETNVTLKSKDRRSGKRKAEAIASQASGCSASELLEWYQQKQQQQQQQQQQQNVKYNNNTTSFYKKKYPNIAFIGQLSFDTTADDLFEHIRKELSQNFEDNQTDGSGDGGMVVTKDKFRIRLLTTPQSDGITTTPPKSRGMAFVEVDDLESINALLKLHHTVLKGRRINVEQTTAGGKEKRAMTSKTFREEQNRYVMETVQNMFQAYHNRGEIQPTGELDDGVIALCTRHATKVVQATLERYVETNGREKNNPSAYFSFLLGKLATEGIYSKRDEERKRNQDKDCTASSNIQHASKRARIT